MSNLHLLGLRSVLVAMRRVFLTRVMGMDLHPSVQMSLSAKPDMVFPRGVHVGERSYVAFGARILTHDRTRGLYLHTSVGKNCFIGGESLILPGVKVGDNCVVGAGSVVTKDVPDRCVVAGNPAKIVQTDIEVGHYGRFLDADAKERSLRATDPAVGALPHRLADESEPKDAAETVAGKRS